jgi:hypothetical protein
LLNTIDRTIAPSWILPNTGIASNASTAQFSAAQPVLEATGAGYQEKSLRTFALDNTGMNLFLQTEGNISKSGNPFNVIDTSMAGGGDPTTWSWQLATLSAYYMVSDSTKTFIDFGGGDNPNTPWVKTSGPPIVYNHFSSAANFNVGTPNGPLHPATIASAPLGATESSSIVTITTSVAHGFGVGDVVSISGVGAVGYNGIFTIISVPSSTTFTYKDGVTGLPGSGGGTASSLATAYNHTDSGSTYVSEVYQRQFTVGSKTVIVFFQPLSQNQASGLDGSPGGDANTISLGGSYQILNSDGSLSSPVTSITISNQQGMILISSSGGSIPLLKAAARTYPAGLAPTRGGAGAGPSPLGGRTLVERKDPSQVPTTLTALALEELFAQSYGPQFSGVLATGKNAWGEVPPWNGLEAFPFSPVVFSPRALKALFSTLRSSGEETEALPAVATHRSRGVPAWDLDLSLWSASLFWSDGSRVANDGIDGTSTLTLVRSSDGRGG